MVRKGRRHSGKKLQPPLPEAKDEPVIPKYFNMIRGSGYREAEEERREILPGPMPRSDETPRAIRGRQVLKQRTPFPDPAPEPERIPLLIRGARYFATVLGVEPERPVAMPVVPELNYPALYTRYPIMKTVTKTTDAAGEIAVTYSHTFVTIPGVVITVKDPDNVFGTVFSTTLTGFEVRLFKMEHDHGGVVDDAGAHTPTINADGNHKHQIQGTGSLSLSTNYGRLVLANYTDYEKTHVHSNPQTGYESSHTHPKGRTGGPDDTASALTGMSSHNYCAACDDWIVQSFDSASFAESSHWHLNTGLSTGTGTQHRHPQGNTGVDTNPLGHRHLISDDLLYNHYVYNVDLTLDLWTSQYENPYHAHTGGNIVDHGHGVAADGRVLLKNTNVTITYIAQEESS